MSSSISRRLIFWLAVPLLLMALLGSLARYLTHVAPGMLESDRRLRAAANTLMAHLTVAGGHVTLDESPEAMRAMPPTDLVGYAVRDTAGHLLAGDERIPPVTVGAEMSQLLAMTQVDKRSLRTLTTRFDTRAGVVIITVADLKPADTAARYGFMSTLLWDFVQLDITLVLVWFGIQWGLKPIRRLREEIAERSPHDLRPIVDAAAPREVAPVVSTLNRLFAALREAGQSQQNFIANTAHQLRTPITGIQAQLEVLMAESAAQPVRERLEIMQTSIRQLAHTANQLLTLARADRSANLAGRNQAADLKAVASEVAGRYFDRALQANIDFGLDAESAQVSADPALLDDLFGNLIDNALKYTPAGGHITVSTGRRSGHAYLQVEDTGCGIPEGDRQRVLQRFYRVRDAPGHGTGLGLAIVNEIVQLYDGQLSIEHGASGRGTRIAVRFP